METPVDTPRARRQAAIVAGRCGVGNVGTSKTVPSNAVASIRNLAPRHGPGERRGQGPLDGGHDGGIVGPGLAAVARNQLTIAANQVLVEVPLRRFARRSSQLLV